jgi:phosphoribosylglycinamide formyltransferase-1
LITDNPQAGAIGVARSYGIDAHTIQPPTRKAGLPIEIENEIVEWCDRRGIDLIALAGFMRILKGPLLERYAGRIMNIHPSLLPSFPGLHAVRQAIDQGVRVTGCTVHFVDRTVDGGAIILQGAVPVEPDDTEETLLERVHSEEHRIYTEAIRLFAEGRLRQEGKRVRILNEMASNHRKRN